MCFISSTTTPIVLENICVCNICRNHIFLKDEKSLYDKDEPLGIPNTLTLNISCLDFLNSKLWFPLQYLHFVQFCMMVNNVLWIFWCMPQRTLRLSLSRFVTTLTTASFYKCNIGPFYGVSCSTFFLIKNDLVPIKCQAYVFHTQKSFICFSLFLL